MAHTTTAIDLLATIDLLVEFHAAAAEAAGIYAIFGPEGDYNGRMAEAEDRATELAEVLAGMGVDVSEPVAGPWLPVPAWDEADPF